MGREREGWGGREGESIKEDDGKAGADCLGE